MSARNGAATPEAEANGSEDVRPVAIDITKVGGGETKPLDSGGGGSSITGGGVALPPRQPTSQMPRLNESSAWLLTQHAERTRVRNRIAALQAEADSLAHEIADLMDTDRAMTAGIDRLEEMQGAGKGEGNGSE